MWFLLDDTLIYALLKLNLSRHQTCHRHVIVIVLKCLLSQTASIPWSTTTVWLSATRIWAIYRTRSTASPCHGQRVQPWETGERRRFYRWWVWYTSRATRPRAYHTFSDVLWTSCWPYGTISRGKNLFALCDGVIRWYRFLLPGALDLQVYRWSLQVTGEVWRKSLSTWRFGSTDRKRKRKVFMFKLSSHDHICSVKYLFASRDD